MGLEWGDGEREGTVVLLLLLLLLLLLVVLDWKVLVLVLEVMGVVGGDEVSVEWGGGEGGGWRVG